MVRMLVAKEKNMSTIALSKKAAKLMKLSDLEGFRSLSGDVF
jgi:hypothetical protein